MTTSDYLCGKKWLLRPVFFLAATAMLLLTVAELNAPSALADQHHRQGQFNVLLLRVYFWDLRVVDGDPERSPRFTREAVQNILNREVSDHFETISFGNVSINAEVSPEFKLDYSGGSVGPPWPRAWYTTGRPGDKYFSGARLRKGAISSARQAFANGTEAWRDGWEQSLPTMWNKATGDFDWGNIDGIFAYVIDTPYIIRYAEIKPESSYRSETARPNIFFDKSAANTSCDDESGVPTDTDTGCGYLMEGVMEINDPPGWQWDDFTYRWGVFVHEIGHMLQTKSQHPSEYQSNFELMDSSYPGSTGAYSLYNDQLFGGWLPAEKFYVMPSDVESAFVSISAIEHPLDTPGLGLRGIKVELSDHEYYMISLRKRIPPDNLPSHPSGPHDPPGIPDEGVLIVRVNDQVFDKVTHETACPRLSNFILKPFEECTFEVRYSPKRVGASFSGLVIQTQGGFPEVALRGRGLADGAIAAGEEIIFIGDEIRLGPLELRPDGSGSHGFGSVEVGEQAVYRLTLQNVDVVEKVVDSIKIGFNDDEFAVNLDFERQCPLGTYSEIICGTARVMGNLGEDGRENRDILWQQGDVYQSNQFTGWYVRSGDRLHREFRLGSRLWRNDGVRIEVLEAGENVTRVYISREEVEGRPDMMLRRWRSNPEPEAYETTDIWIDSPLNGYCGGGDQMERILPPDIDGVAACEGQYATGVRSDAADPYYGTVVGNGDAPAIGTPNRIYARVRNVGESAAKDVNIVWEVQFRDIEGAPGLGIGPEEWVEVARL